MLDENLIAGLNEDGHGEVICAGGAKSGGDILRCDAALASDGFDQGRIAVGSGAGELERVKIDWEVGERVTLDAAISEVVFDADGGGLDPLHVGGAHAS
jgi:hypothetical protein